MSDSAVKKAFDGKTEVSLDDFGTIVTDVLKLPKIFKKMAFDRIKDVEKLDEKLEKIPKQTFINFYKKNSEGVDVKR